MWSFSSAVSRMERISHDGGILKIKFDVKLRLNQSGNKRGVVVSWCERRRMRRIRVSGGG